MNNRPIGIFDSGLGGLTAQAELLRMLPDENLIYFGDTGRMPYGGRPREEIRLIARQNLSFVEKHGVKAMIAACGTISSNAQDILENNGVKVIGVMLPGVRELVSSGAKRLCVIATKTSIESGAFQREIHKLAPDAEVLALACPDFVPMIESGHIDAADPLVIKTVAETLAPVKAFGCEAMLLGCTHYGIIAEAISNYLPEARLIGAADAAARQMRDYLSENAMLSDNKTCTEYYTSGSTEDFETLAPVMLGHELESPVRFVPPMPTEE